MQVFLHVLNLCLRKCPQNTNQTLRLQAGLKVRYYYTLFPSISLSIQCNRLRWGKSILYFFCPLRFSENVLKLFFTWSIIIMWIIIWTLLGLTDRCCQRITQIYILSVLLLLVSNHQSPLLIDGLTCMFSLSSVVIDSSGIYQLLQFFPAVIWYEMIWIPSNPLLKITSKVKFYWWCFLWRLYSLLFLMGPIIHHLNQSHIFSVIQRETNKQKNRTCGTLVPNNGGETKKTWGKINSQIAMVLSTQPLSLS